MFILRNQPFLQRVHVFLRHTGMNNLGDPRIYLEMIESIKTSS